MNDCLSLFQAVQLTFPYHLQDPVLFCLLQVNASFQTVHVGGGSNETPFFFFASMHLWLSMIDQPGMLSLALVKVGENCSLVRSPCFIQTGLNTPEM